MFFEREIDLIVDIQKKLMYIILYGEIMQEIISFLKEVFLMKEQQNSLKIGLSQFKPEEKKEAELKPKKISPSEIKISDLMRRA